ncbi:MAG: hypothetical protein ACP5Q0_05460, partial [Halothiobacillus sp.]
VSRYSILIEPIEQAVRFNFFEVRRRASVIRLKLRRFAATPGFAERFCEQIKWAFGVFTQQLTKGAHADLPHVIVHRDL